MAGSKVSDAAAVATTDRIIPSAIARKTITGTRKIAASDATTVRAERNTALPAVANVAAMPASASWPWARSSR